MQNQPFTYESRAQRVLFGAGTLAQAPAELERMGAHKALVLCTAPQRAQAEAVAALLGPRAAGIFDGAVMHVPMASAEAARAAAAQAGANALVAVGGGSTVGLAKAIALVSPLPVLAIPTTYAGSEMTPIYGLTENGLKRTGRDVRVLPRSVLYDPELTLALPVGLSVVSGINAIAHAAEGLYAADGNPVMGLMAAEGIAALGRALPALHAAPHDLHARSDALYGAWLCGLVLGSVSMALHHKLCHTLGGSFNLPHAELHTVVLPHVLAYNAKAAPHAMQRIAAALGTADAALGVHTLARRLGAPTALRDIGMREEDLDKACALALRDAYPNPRPIEAAPLRNLLQEAFEGAAPRPPNLSTTPTQQTTETTP
ncbi:Maleylacetate reductase [Sphingobium herbicidovorans NBRC 16415]|uniref:Maleylacetate reductase n=2 Tax=Pseudomonadota TaxID=1224 RepID=A0A086P6J2_SPHHM|nr:maleylacetate reductase [Sphingobium herbicidovorans]ADM86736.1 alcohol dehydrogenase [Delftia acidovorans]AEV56891.1 putative alcohol dehydrogenase [uncultured bacterium]AEV57430.1 putative alcohol dehydrogenase [uncultured bacterium]KFG89010.1 Maleylacetate reductase [Sphingobium herbicidovorans NBRC 16415]